MAVSNSAIVKANVLVFPTHFNPSLIFVGKGGEADIAILINMGGHSYTVNKLVYNLPIFHIDFEELTHEMYTRYVASGNWYTVTNLLSMG
jgi:hypothetical protein